MSHLLQESPWERSNGLNTEAHQAKKGREEARGEPIKPFEDEWNHLWTDVGGEG